MKELEKIGVLSAAKITSIMGAIFGLIGSILIVILGSLPQFADLGYQATGQTFQTILLSIVSYAIIGYISGALYAVFYNLATKYTKGIEIKLK